MRIRGGYYLGGNKDARADMTAIGARALTHYRSLAEGSILPEWIGALLREGDTMVNLVLELKLYGTAGLSGQIVNGVKVPPPSMMIQRRDGKGVPAYGYGQVLRGEINALLDRFLQRLQVMPNPGMINVQLASEFDTDHEFGTTEVDPDGAEHLYSWEESDARALDAVDYISGYLLDHGMPANTTLSVGMGGFDRPSFKRMHPAWLAPYCGALQWNVYRRTATQSAYQVFNRTKAWALTDLPTMWQLKPVIIAEWGTAPKIKDQAPWIITVPAALDQLNDGPRPHIAVANYFNSNYDWATLDPKAAGLDALKGAYATHPFTEEAPRAWYR